MKTTLRRVLLQATSLIGALVLILCVGYKETLCAEIPEKAAQIIKKIEIRGTQRISTAAIKSSIRVKEGDRYSPLAVSRMLMQSGLWGSLIILRWNLKSSEMG